MRQLIGLVCATAMMGLAACSSEAPMTNAPVSVQGLATTVVNPVTWPREREWDGRVEAIDHATLAAQTGGRVAELTVDVGDLVEEGHVLVRFTTTEQQAGQRQAQAALQAARAQADEAATAYQRVREIRARGLVAQSELDRAQTAHDAAQAQLAAARAGLKSADEQVGYTAIRAPYRGVVTARHVELGETVGPGQPLLSGVSLDRLRVEVAVPQGVAAQIDPQRPTFVVDASGERHLAERVVVFPQADAASHSVKVRLDLPEGLSGWMPGGSAKAIFSLGKSSVISVPESAIFQRGELTSVVVVEKDGRLGVRQIRPGKTRDGLVEVLAGLEAGETLATNAAEALKARHQQRAQMAE